MKLRVAELHFYDFRFFFDILFAALAFAWLSRFRARLELVEFLRSLKKLENKLRSLSSFSRYLDIMNFLRQRWIRVTGKPLKSIENWSIPGTSTNVTPKRIFNLLHRQSFSLDQTVNSTSLKNEKINSR